MKWAIIVNNVVVNIILWDGPDSSPMEFPEDTTLVELSPGKLCDMGWVWDGINFIAPDEPEAPKEDIISNNTLMKSQLMVEANHQIEVLTDATDPDIMGDDILPEDIELLKQWKAYRVNLSRVTDMLNPVWPDKPNA